MWLYVAWRGVLGARKASNQGKFVGYKRTVPRYIILWNLNCNTWSYIHRSEFDHYIRMHTKSTSNFRVQMCGLYNENTRPDILVFCTLNLKNVAFKKINWIWLKRVNVRDAYWVCQLVCFKEQVYVLRLAGNIIWNLRSNAETAYT